MLNQKKPRQEKEKKKFWFKKKKYSQNPDSTRNICVIDFAVIFLVQFSSENNHNNPVSRKTTTTKPNDFLSRFLWVQQKHLSGGIDNTYYTTAQFYSSNFLLGLIASESVCCSSTVAYIARHILKAATRNQIKTWSPFFIFYFPPLASNNRNGEVKSNEKEWLLQTQLVDKHI
jgi:hypothetical protein